MTKTSTLALLVAVGSAVGLAAGDPTVAVLVRVAAQDGPVQVVGIKLAERPSHDPMVHLRNASSKDTVRTWVEAVISGRDGKITRISSNASNELWPAERAIRPASDAWAHEVVLESSRLVMAAKNLRSNCLNVTLLVKNVDFADGTSWDRDHGQKGVSWTYPTQEHAEDPCRNSTATESEVSQIAGAGHRTGSDSETAHDHDEVQFYSFSCSLVPGNHGLIAMCPF
jgi:hypothetical protein